MLKFRQEIYDFDTRVSYLIVNQQFFFFNEESFLLRNRSINQG